MSYPRINAADLRATISPLDFYKDELSTMPAPRRSGGWIPAGLCPFHDDRHAGSFRVNLDSGGFFCHACETGGKSIIDFLMLRDGLTFKEALAELRREWGC